MLSRSEGEDPDLISTRSLVNLYPQDPGLSDSEFDSTSRSYPLTKGATAGSSDRGFEIIPPTSEIF